MPGWQLPFASQQPLGHEVASHTHWPLTQRVPAPQAGPLPQAHCPPMQALAAMGLHAEQATPWSPQAWALGARHCEPEQHPAQVALSQVQAPPTHFCPGPHAPPSPHPQPAAPQRSVSGLSVQSAQSTPLRPQWLSAGTWQTPFTQQPAQLLTLQPSHAPPGRHAPPSPQVWQRAPPTPQRALVVPSSQRVPLQQPPQLAFPQTKPLPPPAPPPLAPPPPTAPPPAEPPPEPPEPPPAPAFRQTPPVQTRPSGQACVSSHFFPSAETASTMHPARTSPRTSRD